MSLLGRILGNASEIPAEELSTKYERLLTDSEQVELGFKLTQEYKIAQERIEVTQKGLKDAALLFRGGFANYLEVITAQSDALESELNEINTKKQILIANIELYRSLGGGWQ